jgi:cbb3-type cytochrome oxidase subunit 3
MIWLVFYIEKLLAAVVWFVFREAKTNQKADDQ